MESITFDISLKKYNIIGEGHCHGNHNFVWTASNDGTQ